MTLFLKNAFFIASSCFSLPFASWFIQSLELVNQIIIRFFLFLNLYDTGNSFFLLTNLNGAYYRSNLKAIVVQYESWFSLFFHKSFVAFREVHKVAFYDCKTLLRNSSDLRLVLIIGSNLELTQQSPIRFGPRAFISLMIDKLWTWKS